MKAEELRIGNFIEQGKVFEVKPYHVRVSYWHVHKQQDAMSLVKLDECEPIPLSEEVLLKCGFKDYEGWYQKEGIQLYRIRDLYFRGNFPIKADIVHLHQLQNLFYSLTGEELEVSWT